MQFIKYEIQNGFAVYLVKVMAPNSITFHIRDRYSSMRNFQSMLRKKFSLKTFDGFPSFPKKTLFTKLSDEFLTQRMNQMQNFFNLFFSKKEIG